MLVSSETPKPVSHPSEPVHQLPSWETGTHPLPSRPQAWVFFLQVHSGLGSPRPTAAAAEADTVHHPSLHPHQAPCSSSASPTAVQPCRVPGINPSLDHNLPTSGARLADWENPGEMDSHAGGLQPPHCLIVSSCFLQRVPIPSWRPDVGDKDSNFHLSWVAPLLPPHKPQSLRGHISQGWKDS